MPAPFIGGQPAPISTSSRQATSPIGTSSPNSGATGNTNSTYGLGAYTSGITELASSVTAYKLNDTDYQGVILFDTDSAVTVTLNSAVKTNFTCTILNLAGGAVTFTPTSGTVNGASSLSAASGQGGTVFFGNGNWVVFVGTTVIPVVPHTIAAVAGEYLTAYDAATGLFSQSTPASISVTITTAKLTTGGTNGSMTFQNGLLTAQVQAT